MNHTKINQKSFDSSHLDETTGLSRSEQNPPKVGYRTGRQMRMQESHTGGLCNIVPRASQGRLKADPTDPKSTCG